ncbi:hypothetical protein RHGRI_000384 [Rhododendron griersonianum]|uniref:AT-hook motif nuclear-localized protein n=1 Tax=Rhododendron griersonianum TaxID=479676 RepID=A0AAV6LGD6_9ERIC|nr:hypothetical protein RHGRI_000384 [Rhododendron griersonianum]
MDSTNASAPLLQVEGETQLPHTLVETTIVKVEVTDTGMNENSVIGGGESGDVDSEVTLEWLLFQSPHFSERTSRVAPNGSSKRRRVSTNQTVSTVIFTITWRFLAVLWLQSSCREYLSPNGSELVLSSCGEENGAKEHLELGQCIDEANMHDDNSLDRRNGRMRFSDFHGFLWLLPSAVFSFPQGCNLRSREGQLAVDTAGGNFTTHVLNILVGEDIFGKILSIVQTSPRAVCLLTVVGAVAIVDMCPAGYFGSSVLRHEA